MRISRAATAALLVAAWFPLATGCAMSGQKPSDPPLPSGHGEWRGRPISYQAFVAAGRDSALSPDDRLAFARVANPTDEVWDWRTPLGQAGVAVVRNGKVLAVAITAFGLNQRR